MKTLVIIFLIALSVKGMAQNQKTPMQAPTPYTILILMQATPQWLTLTRNERSRFVEKELTPILTRVNRTVKVNFYDSEYFHASVSDFMIVTTTELDDYKLLIELLRDTKIYGAPYFEIKDIIVGQENLYQDFNKKLNP